MPAHQARAGNPAPAGDDDRPPRRQVGVDPRLEAQAAFARRQYIVKHLSPAHRPAALAALAFGYALRAALADRASGRRESACVALVTLLGRAEPLFGRPPELALGSKTDA